MAAQPATESAESQDRCVRPGGVIGHAVGSDDTVLPWRAPEIQTALRKAVGAKAALALKLLIQRGKADPIVLAAIGAFEAETKMKLSRSTRPPMRVFARRLTSSFQRFTSTARSGYCSMRPSG